MPVPATVPFEETVIVPPGIPLGASYVVCEEGVELKLVPLN